MNTPHPRELHIDTAVEEILHTLRDVTKSGINKYTIGSASGDELKLTLYRMGFFPKEGQLYCRIWLTLKGEADVTASNAPKECLYEFRHLMFVRRFVPSAPFEPSKTQQEMDRRKQISDKEDISLKDIFNLNMYLRTWNEVYQ